MKDGIRSTRASASPLHAVPLWPWASCSAIIPAKGQPGPVEAPSGRDSGVSSKAWGRWCARDERRCSKGTAGSDRPPTLTPRLRISWVSAGVGGLVEGGGALVGGGRAEVLEGHGRLRPAADLDAEAPDQLGLGGIGQHRDAPAARSEERRVGKE